MKETVKSGGIPSSAGALVCQKGIVEQVTGGKALVRIEQPDQCHACAGRDSCSALSAEGKLIEVEAAPGLSAGKRVELGLKPSAMLAASVLLFLLPAVAFLTGLVCGVLLAEAMEWSGGQWLGLALGAALFCLAYVVIRLLSGRLERSGRFEPEIIRIVE